MCDTVPVEQPLHCCFNKIPTKHVGVVHIKQQYYHIIKCNMFLQW